MAGQGCLPVDVTILWGILVTAPPVNRMEEMLTQSPQASTLFLVSGVSQVTWPPLAKPECLKTARWEEAPSGLWGDGGNRGRFKDL